MKPLSLQIDPYRYVPPTITWHSKARQLIQKIYEFIINLFKPNPFRRTLVDETEIRHARVMQSQRIRSTYLPANPAFQPGALQDMEPINLDQSVMPQHNYFHFSFQEIYLHRAGQAIVGIASDSADLIYKEKVEPLVLLIQQGSKGVPDLLKLIAEVALKLGQTADKHYGELIKEQDPRGLIGNEFRMLLNWICLDDFTNDPALRIAHKEKLFVELQHRLSVNLPIELQDYLLPTLQWVIRSDHRQPFKSCFHELETYKESSSKKVLSAVVEGLIECKIDSYVQYINRLVQGNLPEILHTYIRENVAKMASHYEAKHLLLVIKELSWTDLIDNAVTIIHNQITGYIRAVRAKENAIKFYNEDVELNQRVALYQARMAAQPADRDEIKLKEEAQTAFEQIGEDFQRDQVVSYWQAFAEQAHPAIKAVIDANLDNGDVAKAESEANAEFFGEMADNIINILLPGDEKNIAFWLDKLTFPPEFKEMFRHTVNILQEIISPGMLALLSLPKDWQDVIKERLPQLAILSIKKWLKEIVVAALAEKLAQYSDPDEIDEIMAEQVLPDIIIPQMVQTTAKHVLFADIKGFSEDFTKLRTNAREATLVRLKRRFFEGTQRLLPHVQFGQIQMTEEKFYEIITPFLQDLEIRLEVIQQENYVLYNRDRVESLLKKYFDDDQTVQDNRPVYGKLVTDLITEMSTAGGWAKWGIKKSEDALSKILVTSMQDIRSSPEFMVKLFTEKLSTLMAKDKLPGLFFGEPAPKREAIRADLKTLETDIESAEAISHPTVEQSARLTRLKADHENHRLIRTRNKLRLNIRVLSNIVYDIAMAKMDYYGRQTAQAYTFDYLGGFGASVTKYVGAGVIGTPDDLNTMITDLYTKLVGDPLRNSNMLYQVLTLFVRSLAEKSKKVYAK